MVAREDTSTRMRVCAEEAQRSAARQRIVAALLLLLHESVNDGSEKGAAG
eukprot:COSAG01_NODE_2855_length_6961_cov_3.612260_2_plen_50_part_00